jgi:hypothetical protein
MNPNSPLSPAEELAVTDGMASRSASNLVIDSLDEFAVSIFLCATSADYAIGSL